MSDHPELRAHSATNADDRVLTRVEALLTDMTIEEKAGQLTQYFYFDLPSTSAAPAGEDASPVGDLSQQPRMVEGELAATPCRAGD